MRAYLWWTNIAVEESEGMRVFAPADEVIYINPAVEQNGQIGYGMSRMPVLPFLPDKDFSYPWESNFSNEYFFQVPDNEKAPWEAAVYEDGRIFFETSTSCCTIVRYFVEEITQGGDTGRNIFQYLVKAMWECKRVLSAHNFMAWICLPMRSGSGRRGLWYNFSG